MRGGSHAHVSRITRYAVDSVYAFYSYDFIGLYMGFKIYYILFQLYLPFPFYVITKKRIFFYFHVVVDVRLFSSVYVLSRYHLLPLHIYCRVPIQFL